MMVRGVPLENNTSEANAAAYRTAAANYVASVANPLLKFVDLGGSFDRTAVATYYVTTDTSGNHVHANDAGHAAEAVQALTSISNQSIVL